MIREEEFQVKLTGFPLLDYWPAKVDNLTTNNLDVQFKSAVINDLW